MREILRPRPEWRIIAEACDGEEAVRQSIALQPDIVLLDIGLPKMNGIEAARRIRHISPASRIVFLTADGNQDIMQVALSITGAGYILKANVASQLVGVIAATLADR